jgi:hypothetical protein
MKRCRHDGHRKPSKNHLGSRQRGDGLVKDGLEVDEAQRVRRQLHRKENTAEVRLRLRRRSFAAIKSMRQLHNNAAEDGAVAGTQQGHKEQAKSTTNTNSANTA